MEPQINSTILLPKKPFPLVVVIVPLAFLIGAISFGVLTYFSPKILLDSGILKKDLVSNVENIENKELIENVNSQVVEADSVKYLSINDKELGIEFLIPIEGFFIDYRSSEGGGWQIIVMAPSRDKAENGPTHLQALVTFSNQVPSLFDADDLVVSDSDIEELTIMGDKYPVRTIGSGAGSGPLGGISVYSHHVKISNKLYATISEFSSLEMAYEEADITYENPTILHEYNTSDKDIEDAINIVESLKQIKK